MEVILREDVDKLGRAGEVVKVKPGFARNYLLPNSLAFPASEGAKRRIEAEQRHRVKRLHLEREEATKVAVTLSALTLTFVAKTGDGDRLFGSITAADIADKLAEHGHKIDKRIIDLPEPIKIIGEHRVPIRLHSDVRPEVAVTVEKES
jgi:large subunit ribosomal protein L9